MAILIGVAGLGFANLVRPLALGQASPSGVDGDSGGIGDFTFRLDLVIGPPGVEDAAAMDLVCSGNPWL